MATNTKIETKETVKGIGNTKQSPQLVNWFFTFNNYYSDNIRVLEQRFKEICKWYVFQEEKGKNGTPHLQGSICLKKKMRWTEFGLPTAIHWEKTRNIESAIDYCQKLDSRNGNIYKWGFVIIETITVLKDWQREIETFILNNKPDGRTVHWYCDKVGGMGKSAFCKYMYIKHQSLIIQGGKLSDIMNIIFNTDMSKITSIIVDIPRCNENHISYASVECMLNGMITNTKYETGIKCFNPCHIYIFSNFLPEQEKLSKDRWDIHIMKN
nr:rep protein [Cressdnaviricota sp.]